MTPAELVAELYEARIEQDLTLREFAELSGITKDAVSEIERGARDPRLSTLVQHAEVLGLEVIVRPRRRR